MPPPNEHFLSDTHLRTHVQDQRNPKFCKIKFMGGFGTFRPGDNLPMHDMRKRRHIEDRLVK